MSTPFRTGQFDDAEAGIGRMQEEFRRSQQASAASRVASTQLGFTAGRPRTAESTFMSMLGAADAASGAAPYYQRQSHSSPYGRPYLTGQGNYAGVHSPNDAVTASLYAQRRAAASAAYGYGVASGTSPDQRYNPYAVPTPSRDFSSQYFGRSAHEMSLLDRAYSSVQRTNQQEQNPILATSTSAVPKPSTTTAASALPATNSISYIQQKSPAPKAPPSPSRASPTRTTKATRGGRGKGKGSRGAASSTAAAKEKIGVITPKDSKDDDESEDGDKKWYSGSVPLGLEDDKYWLSELQVFLRANFAEAFGATEEDIAAPMHGRNKPIALGQVGIRCMHCKNDNPAERGQQATSYPSLISGIYNSVQQMLRLHLDCCLSMPAEVRQKIEQLKLSSSSRGGRKQYWIDSAKRLGLVDTPHGIHFGRDPHGPLPPLSGPSVNSKEGRKKTKAEQAKNSADAPGSDTEAAEARKQIPQVDPRPLVFPEDKPLISDFLYLTLEQMSPCVLMEADRVGCYKTRKVGFPGLACKHCVGQAGCGRYFPASEASLSQTTTSQTIMNHVRNCRRCPVEIRENLEIMKRARMGPDGKRADKPKHGGRKVFFHRLWCRIQGIPMEDGKGETKEKKKRGNKSTGTQKAGKKRLPPTPDSSDHEEDSEDEDKEDDTPDLSATSEEENETEEESINDDSDAEDTAAKLKVKAKPAPIPKPTTPKKKIASIWFDGCVRLTKTDDPHWLSEMECFARSDLVEVFSLKKKDLLDGYGGRKEPARGQVGIRCIFCKVLDPSERPNGYMCFPESLASVHTKVGDLIRLHFPSCPSMPEDARETFKSLRGFDAKVADDSQQYWVDAARDIGLGNVPPDGPYAGWGITFRRDPLQPSPADDVDRELIGATSSTTDKGSLVRVDEDRGLCTDQVMLLLRNVKACRFKKSDRRGGPGARGRDRVIGFPGLCCKHCTTKNSIGRYFPVSAKNLTDSTANSLQSHVSSCTRCPEPIKASLAYLSHRSILQKAELSGSWKKTFFKKVWDRLHVERLWNDSDEESDKDVEDAASDQSEEEQGEEEPKEGSAGSGSDREEEDLGDGMDALIKAAAIWLTEQDATSDSVSRTRAARGRGLPQSKRPAPAFASRGKGGGGVTLSSKRRRVHF